MSLKEKTHITMEEISPPTLLKTKELYSDGIGYTEQWDFSRANLSHEHRVFYISQIASVCYQSPKAAGSISLYNRLANESAGLPSSSFEFVPILINITNASLKLMYITHPQSHCIKYGEIVHDYDKGTKYLLTNLRALIADVGDQADQFFNTEAECEIIAKHFKVFKWKIPLFVARQAMRHRCSWQELSRRYVSGNKAEFEFYSPTKMLDTVATAGNGLEHYCLKYDELITATLSLYNNAISQGIKPELARTILPQSMYTTVWSAWQPSQLSSFYKLRLDQHAQSEIRELAAGMQSL